MDTFEAIINRRSIRKYKPDKIEETKLHKILEAGLHAPSGVNLQPWYFVAITSDEEIKSFKENISEEVADKITPEIESRFEKHPEIAKETISFIRGLGDAPLIVLVFKYKDDYNKSESTIIQSVAASIENMLIQASAMGIGSCWMTAALETGLSEKIREMYARDRGDLVAVVTFGYPELIPNEIKRKEGRFVII